MEILTKLFEKNQRLGLIIVCIAISAIAGAVFGFYGAQLAEQPAGSTSSIINRITNPTTTVVSDEENKVINVVKKASPAVVSIVATKDLTYVERGWVNPF